VLFGEAQREQLEAVARVLDVYPEWQMVYRGEASALDLGDALPLGEPDLKAMRALAECAEWSAFEENALDKGPYYGVWREGQLVSMAGTHQKLERMAEIGNVVTHPGHRRRGLASMAVSATVASLLAEGLLVFLQVFKASPGAIALYERLGFERTHTMYLVRFELDRSPGG
jgi:ribosomal protein S18 acetylase RimI-like enzyme